MHKLRYITLGGVLMLIGMIASSVLMPSLFAERQLVASVFDAIMCRQLLVVDDDGVKRITLGVDNVSDIAFCGVHDTNGDARIRMGVGKAGGGSLVIGSTDEQAMILTSDEGTGKISLWNNGEINVYDTNNEGKITVGVAKGHGVIVTINKNGELDGIGGPSAR